MRWDKPGHLAAEHTADRRYRRGLADHTDSVDRRGLADRTGLAAEEVEAEVRRPGQTEEATAEESGTFALAHFAAAIDQAASVVAAASYPVWSTETEAVLESEAALEWDLAAAAARWDPAPDPEQRQPS